MAMRDLHLGVALPFETAQEREHSEKVLVRLLGAMCEINLQYLLRNPDTTPLYESGVVYDEPDQLKERKDVTPSRLKRLVALCKEMGLEPEEALMMLRIAKGVEVFLDIPALYSRGKGDCNELAPVRVAELWRAGVIASPYLVYEGKNDRGGHSYHAVVWYPQDDTIEDPSLILGMGGPARSDERRAEIQKNADRRAAQNAAAQQLIASGEASPAVIGPLIDSMGFVPRDGVFRIRRAA